MKNLLPLPILLFSAIYIFAGFEPILANQETPIKASHLIYEAGSAMDKAWDAFHKAALGGTLASPEIQTAAEAGLMEGRALLRKARKAQHEENLEEVKRLTEQIQQISQEVVIKSQMEKER